MIETTKRFAERCKLPAAMLILAVVAYSCANIVSPSGGPRDISPPEILMASPESGSVLFNGQSFTLRFNEYVQLGNLQQQMLISPPLSGMPKFTLRGKSLKVSFSDTLIPNTTYAFFFGDAIKDITENNPMASYTFFFSTGDFIDSLELRGKVVNAWDQKVEENIFVLLYAEPVADSAFAREIPRYVTRPDKTGAFAFKHLAEGSYHLVAVADLNNNMLYDLITEAVAFYPEPVIPRYVAKAVKDTVTRDAEPDSAMNWIDTVISPSEIVQHTVFQNPVLYMFKGEDSIQRVTAARSESRQKVFVSYRYPLKGAEIEVTDSLLKDRIGIEWGERLDTFWVWLREHTADTLPLIVRYDGAADTLNIQLRQPPLGGRGRQLDPRVGVTMNVPRNGKIHMEQKPELRFTIPLVSLDTDQVLLLSESDTVSLMLSSQDTLLKKRFIVENKLEIGKKYRIIIPERACNGWDGTFNDSVDWAFSVDPPENFGTLRLIVNIDNDYSGGFLLMLMDEKSAILEERMINAGATEIFSPLEPSRYLLKMVADTNRNGKWDTGDYWRRIQPEKVLSLPNPVTIRANWEEEVEWNISPEP
jgi:hypothetical protein